MKPRLQIPPLVTDTQRLRQTMTGGRVFDILREAIVRLQLPPGTRLSESEIGKQLNVSRQPVREAFIKLDEVGLVEIRPQRGTVVRLISQREVHNIRFLREAVEVAIIRRAVEKASSSDVQKLKAIVAAQQALPKDDHTQFLQLDEEFHQALAHSADCNDAWQILDRLKLQMDRVRYLSFPDATPLNVLIDQHERIVQNVEQRDADKAEAVMREHLLEILTSLPKLAKQYPGIFAD